MKTSRRYRTAVWYAGMILLACLASGCGQKGGLTRPESPTASNL
ncbi:MAG: LPS translocon maturation chaperone LptM [Pseudohongiellaceae bacterium]